ncbi:MAG TPA: glutamate formimidoyltransferase [Bryobacteraceae bacterium]|nr:glutamate formimidoyltransferase [Bryobacteraceae bacterium]
MRLVECVPNFSEGRNKKSIDAITETIAMVEGVELLDVDPGASTNRTVVTFVGDPEAALEAAFLAIAKAAQLIDMRQHRGAHPRLGATDVCPFVPVTGVTMADCVELAKRLGDRVGKELSIPVYLYAEAAQSEDRRNLADVRKGEYEMLAERMRNGFNPDFGPQQFNAAAGATVVGARKFLIAYNVDLNTRSAKLANEIALEIREAGRAQRDADGNIIKAADGTTLKTPGKLQATKAIGWYVEEYQRAQISINLVDYEQTAIHTAFDQCCKEAEKLGLRVTGSEIVGLVPLMPMLMAGRHYLSKQGRCAGVPEADLISSAVSSLGLSDVAPFDPQKKIIEYRVAPKEKLLKDLTVAAFIDELSRESPAPGGGSVAALCAALSAALTSMVANLTIGKKGFEASRPLMNDLAEQAQKLKAEFIAAIDDDTKAFSRIGAARQLPKDTDDNKRLRDQAIEQANKDATMVPLLVLEKTVKAIEIAEIVMSKGNPNTLSDAGVAALTARAAADGALYNVLINLQSLSDQAFITAIRQRALLAAGQVREKAEMLHGEMVSRLQQA